jgi:hypothetical protein
VKHYAFMLLFWLKYKLSQGYDITEYKAASRLTEFFRKNEDFMGLVYKNNLASGPNAGQPVRRFSVCYCALLTRCVQHFPTTHLSSKKLR